MDKEELRALHKERLRPLSLASGAFGALAVDMLGLSFADN
jgi:hypothetical protein